MLLYARFPHASVTVQWNGIKLKAANSSLKVCWEPSDEYVTRIPLELSNYGLIINTWGKWLLSAPDITHPCKVPYRHS